MQAPEAGAQQVGRRDAGDIMGAHKGRAIPSQRMSLAMQSEHGIQRRVRGDGEVARKGQVREIERLEGNPRRAQRLQGVRERGVARTAQAKDHALSASRSAPCTRSASAA